MRPIRESCNDLVNAAIELRAASDQTQRIEIALHGQRLVEAGRSVVAAALRSPARAR